MINHHQHPEAPAEKDPIEGAKAEPDPDTNVKYK
jgi:hypothetical protein